MLGYPLSSIHINLGIVRPNYYTFYILRPSHPPLYFTYPVGNLSDGVRLAGKYLMGYCDICDSVGEKCKDGKRLEDRPVDEKNLM
jgi:hypothetical protein